MATIKVDAGPLGICVSPDGSKVYVSNSSNNTVNVINTATNAVSATIQVDTGPSGLCISPDGSKLYVVCMNDRTVNVISSATNKVTATIPVGSGPHGISVSPDGSKIYVANMNDKTVSVITTATNKVTSKITVGAGPIAFGNFISTHLNNSVKDNAKDSTTVLGIDFLCKIVGLWNGPVTSSTPAGSFDNWYVDFRPVSSGQVSQYTAFDTSAINYTSFFIVKHKGQLKLAMRTQGVFDNKACVTYEVLDSVNEAKGYYRFSDFQSGIKRAYTEFRFKNNDEFVMEVYTNKFNTVTPVQLHSKWQAKLASRKASADAVTYFNFPKPVMVKDFTAVFKNMTESIYYTFENDPYPSSPQPYVGSVTVNISTEKKIKMKNIESLCLLLTTEPLFDGLKYESDNLKYTSKYVFLPAKLKSFTIKNVHPGKYYLYSFVYKNSDKKLVSGDYMSSSNSNAITVKPNNNTEAETKIDYVIP
jgi:YVTN family beta-propeller protein